MSAERGVLALLVREARESVQYHLADYAKKYNAVEFAGSQQVQRLQKLLKDIDNVVTYAGMAEVYTCTECGQRPSEPDEIQCCFCLNRRNGLVCSVCSEPQVTSWCGDVCINGHGGAPGLEEDDIFG